VERPLTHAELWFSVLPCGPLPQAGEVRRAPGNRVRGIALAQPSREVARPARAVKTTASRGQTGSGPRVLILCTALPRLLQGTAPWQPPKYLFRSRRASHSRGERPSSRGSSGISVATCTVTSPSLSSTTSSPWRRPQSCLRADHPDDGSGGTAATSSRASKTYSRAEADQPHLHQRLAGHAVCRSREENRPKEAGHCGAMDGDLPCHAGVASPGEGYDVFAVTDASGGVTPRNHALHAHRMRFADTPPDASVTANTS